ncbi:MAG: aldo/keto reductase, partial [Lachnospiraceae bacterium]|nr:aldo/keto reductase [Lachnospiraceae bacterium]
LAEKYDTSVSDIALRYLFGSSMNVFAVMSTTNPGRLPGNVSAANHPLAKEDIAFLEDGE